MGVSVGYSRRGEKVYASVQYGIPSDDLYSKIRFVGVAAETIPSLTFIAWKPRWYLDLILRLIR